MLLTVVGIDVASAGEETATGGRVEFSLFNDKAFVEARKSGAPVALYFEADWCAPCKEMHARTFPAPVVVEAATGIRFFRVDTSTPDHEVSLVKKGFDVIGVPTVIVFGPDGKERARRFGFIPPDDFAKMLGDAHKPLPGS